MPQPNTRSLRIVVQHVRVHERSAYRLVAYGGEGGDYTSRSAEFESRDRLLKALRSVAPDFDESTVAAAKNAPETYIAFAREMELNDSQLSLLGLQDGRKSSISKCPTPEGFRSQLGSDRIVTAEEHG